MTNILSTPNQQSLESGRSNNRLLLFNKIANNIVAVDINQFLQPHITQSRHYHTSVSPKSSDNTFILFLAPLYKNSFFTEQFMSGTHSKRMQSAPIRSQHTSRRWLQTRGLHYQLILSAFIFNLLTRTHTHSVSLAPKPCTYCRLCRILRF